MRILINLSCLEIFTKKKEKSTTIKLSVFDFYWSLILSSNKLLVAAIRGDIPAVQSFLDAGVDIHACQDAALRWAAHRGQARMVDALLQFGAHVNAEQGAALRWAIRYRHADVVRVLIQHQADMSVLNPQEQQWIQNEALV